MIRPVCVVPVDGWQHVYSQRARAFGERVMNPSASLNRSALAQVEGWSRWLAMRDA